MSPTCRAENPLVCRVHGVNHYKTLGVSKTSTVEEIRQAYRTKVREAHPDFGGSTDTFLQIQTAYETLRHPHTKMQYDIDLRVASFQEQSTHPVFDEGFYEIKDQLYKATDSYKELLVNVQQKKLLLADLQNMPARPNVLAHIKIVEKNIRSLTEQLYETKTRMEYLHEQLKQYAR